MENHSICNISPPPIGTYCLYSYPQSILTANTCLPLSFPLLWAYFSLVPFSPASIFSWFHQSPKLCLVTNFVWQLIMGNFRICMWNWRWLPICNTSALKYLRGTHTQILCLRLWPHSPFHWTCFVRDLFLWPWVRYVTWRPDVTSRSVCYLAFSIYKGAISVQASRAQFTTKTTSCPIGRTGWIVLRIAMSSGLEQFWRAMFLPPVARGSAHRESPDPGAQYGLAISIVMRRLGPLAQRILLKRNLLPLEKEVVD